MTAGGTCSEVGRVDGRGRAARLDLDHRGRRRAVRDRRDGPAPRISPAPTCVDFSRRVDRRSAERRPGEALKRTGSQPRPSAPAWPAVRFEFASVLIFVIVQKPSPTTFHVSGYAGHASARSVSSAASQRNNNRLRTPPAMPTVARRRRRARPSPRSTASHRWPATACAWRTS